jgi:hypothetical protein
MHLPILLPGLAASIHEIPRQGKQKPEASDSVCRFQYPWFSVLWKDEIRSKRRTYECPKIGCSLPIQVDFKFSNIERLSESLSLWLTGCPFLDEALQVLFPCNFIGHRSHLCYAVALLLPRPVVS